jgi:alkanesulfonate monooxygenase SsuD/methylene tetrahydromethanopterin reductase-like flavin-dependent oxidoreductase (luciferase family)
MKFGISLPPFGDYADPHYLTETARAAETAGWDGFFIWDHMFFDPSFHPNVDPWVLARQTVSVDRLSNGRLVLGVGLGDPVQWDFGFFAEETDNKQRAVRLDEGLDILSGLWAGEMFQYEGTHYHVQNVQFLPQSIQSPRIPIWVGGNWPNRSPLRRASRWDGYCPLKEGGMQVEDWREAITYIRQHHTAGTPFDFVHSGQVPEAQWSQAGDLIEPYREIGVNWWIEDVSPWRFGHSWKLAWRPEFTHQMDALIRRGPPAL